MEERFAAGNCYGGNEHSDALSSNTKARSLPSSKIAKVGVNRISRCARCCSAITKIDRDRRQLELHRSFIVSPVVNAQMLPISTRAQRSNSFHFASLHLQSTNRFICEASKSNKAIFSIFTYNGNAPSCEKQFAYVTKLIVAHINWRDVYTSHHDYRNSMLMLQVLEREYSCRITRSSYST